MKTKRFKKGKGLSKVIMDMHLKPKLLEFIKWKVIDLYRIIKYGKQFREFGLTLYCGRQGTGKTIGMVHYLEEMKKLYPECIIVTNFSYINEDYSMENWRDLFKYKNDDKGVIFAIDEIQNEFNNQKWKDFPEHILSEITQQRKQRVKIVATSQVFTRVVKQLREQCFEVVECKTLFGRWTILKAFLADEYENSLENPEKKQKLYKCWRKSFIQTDNLRFLYDTYEKVEKMKDEQFIDREKRVV